MASKEFTIKRIEGKQKEITKLEKKLARIRKVESLGWDTENNPYFYDESDLRWCLKDLESAKEALAEYQADLAEIEAKDASRNVQAIIDFLDGWKAHVKAYYEDMASKYPSAQAEKVTKYKALCAEKKFYEAYKLENSFRSTWSFLTPYLHVVRHRGICLDDEKLAKSLEQEAKDKYDTIIDKTCKIVGTITDASNLSVGSKGDLNGYIIGTDGTASVKTIGAGGYNIQCFHYRTLIHEMK